MDPQDFAVCDTSVDLHSQKSRRLAEDAVRSYYLCEGLPPPKLIIWLRSPLEGAIGADQIASIKCQGPAAMNRQLWDLLAKKNKLDTAEHVLNKIRSQVWNYASDMVGRDIGQQFDLSLRNKYQEIYSPYYSIWPAIFEKDGLNFIRGSYDADLRTGRKGQANFLWEGTRTSQVNRLVDTEFELRYQFELSESAEIIRKCLNHLIELNSSTVDKLPDKSIAFDLQRHELLKKSLYNIAQNCDHVWLFEGVCILTDPPLTALWDSEDRLHCENGPALQYSDGVHFYLWHGVRVPRQVIEAPDLITVDMINNENNLEVRRIMIGRYGLERYVVDSGFMLKQEIPDDYRISGLRSGRLWVKTQGEREPMVFVDLMNSTPESDGTTKRYMLQVDPKAYDGNTMRYVQAAAASTWRNSIGELIYSDWRDYAPDAES